ncbi:MULTISPECIES: NAD(P)/FAD-dependent oxidoreductase [Streptomyces]|uniref:FAD-dependent oxidoreductase n=1 Tax=Streptomyces siderophoricus TaxID=2802281 RepID=A0ABS1MWH9_9ACTN|nr:FAD-dependent oxidoreductase [Streptomyces sp. 9-7]MBL1092066.1 FAD-dependent oxidoreductase [Streptomyces sp. 9-7]
MREVVVVGAGLAGVRAAGALRDEGFDGRLTVVSDERELPYDRPPLTKQVVTGTMTGDDIRLAGDGEFGARWIRGTAAVGLDRERRRVRLADGAELPYDGVVLAPGAKAREWSGAGVPGGVLTVRGLADVRRLRAEVDGGADEVVIVGAGFVGVELASSLSGLGVKVTLVEPFGAPLRALGGTVSQVVTEAAGRAGVALRLGVGVRGFAAAGDGRVRAVVLADGAEVSASLVVVAIGMVPATGWLAGSGLALPSGRIHCDERLFARAAGGVGGTAGAGVADPAVVVAGDAAWCEAVRTAEGPVPLEHWSNAAAQGELAGRNLLAGPAAAEPYVHVPSFWTAAFGLRIRSVGLPGTGDREVVEAGSAAEGAVLVAHYLEERLVGAVSVNQGKLLPGYARRLN